MSSIVRLGSNQADLNDCKVDKTSRQIEISGDKCDFYFRYNFESASYGSKGNLAIVFEAKTAQGRAKYGADKLNISGRVVGSTYGQMSIKGTIETVQYGTVLFETSTYGDTSKFQLIEQMRANFGSAMLISEYSPNGAQYYLNSETINETQYNMIHGNWGTALNE
ncbi:hypothetical protein K2X33_08265 [bacterium]|nr:hypothetical protein [bacterium]